MSVMCCVYFLLSNFIVLFLVLTYTTHLESLHDIPALQNSKTFIRNKQELLEKINKHKKEGPEHLQIVTDFDQTLTADPGEGKIVLNSYEMLRLLPSIPQSYKDEDTKLFYKYKPIDDDPDLSIEEKSKYMVEWYRESQNLLRNGVDELIKWSKDNDVPVLVLSSGLGDAVVASLRAANLLSNNVKVISNFLDIDKNDIIIGTIGDPIHIYNKNDASIKNTDYYNRIKERRNVILLGDSIGDANMVDGLQNCNTVIKIGFLRKKKINDLQNYINNFDIVLVNDQTMDVVNGIINVI